jgi:hypothetical protein
VLAANNKQHDSAFICLLVIVCIYLYIVITTVSFARNLNSGYAIASGNGIVSVTCKRGSQHRKVWIGFEVLIAAAMKGSAFQNVTPCSLVEAS